MKNVSTRRSFLKLLAAALGIGGGLLVATPSQKAVYKQQTAPPVLLDTLLANAQAQTNALQTLANPALVPSQTIAHSQAPPIVKIYTVANPGVGVPVWSLVIPSGVFWRVKSVAMLFVTDSTVLNRAPVLQTAYRYPRYGNTVNAEVPAAATIPASTAAFLTWGAGLANQSLSYTGNQHVSTSLGEVTMDSDWINAILVLNFNNGAGDYFSLITVTVEEYQKVT